MFQIRKTKFQLLFALLFFLPGYFHAQDKSLSQVFKLIDESEQLEQVSLDSSLNYNWRALTLASAIKNDTALAAVVLQRSSQLIKAGKIDSANKYSLRGVKLFRQSGTDAQLHRAYYNRGYYFYYQRQFDSSLYYFTKVYEFQKGRHPNRFAVAAMGVGTHYYYFKKEFSQALNYFYESSEAFKEADRPEGIAGALLFAGLTHQKMNQLDSAEYYIKQSLEVTEQKKLPAKKLESLSYLGKIQLARGERVPAFQNMREALRLSRKTGAKMQEARLLASIALFVTDSAKPEPSLESDIRKFLAQQGGEGNFLKSAETYVMQHAMANNRLQFLQYMADYYSIHQNFSLALDYYKRYNSLQDSLNAQVNARAIAEAEEKFETAKKDKELLETQTKMSILSQEKKLQRLYYGVAILGMLLVALSVIYYARLHRLQAQREVKARQLAEANARRQEAQGKLAQEKVEYQKREMAAQALSLMRHNDMLSQLEEKVSGLKSPELADIKKGLRQNSLQKKDWNHFDQAFTELHPRFINQLLELNPNLTHKEMRLAALVKLGMNNREIANLLSISHTSINQAKYRLKKKLELDSDLSLENYFAGFNNQ